MYFGKAGHLFMMAEFLLRYWNVSIPEVDVGDDIFVVQNDLGKLVRIQVETAIERYTRGCYQASFFLDGPRLREKKEGARVYYVFLVRRSHDWGRPILIPQDKLVSMVQADQNYKKQYTFNLRFESGKVTFKAHDLTPYVDNFDDFPVIEPA